MASTFSFNVKKSHLVESHKRITTIEAKPLVKMWVSRTSLYPLFEISYFMEIMEQMPIVYELPTCKKRKNRKIVIFRFFLFYVWRIFRVFAVKMNNTRSQHVCYANQRNTLWGVLRWNSHKCNMLQLAKFNLIKNKKQWFMWTVQSVKQKATQSHELRAYSKYSLIGGFTTWCAYYMKWVALFK